MNTTEILIGFAGTAAVSSFVTNFFSKGKIKAETDNLIGKTYQEVLQNLRSEMERMSATINNMQQREVEYLKIIGQHKEVESELRKKINQLESQMGKLTTYNDINQTT